MEAELSEPASWIGGRWGGGRVGGEGVGGRGIWQERGDCSEERDWGLGGQVGGEGAKLLAVAVTIRLGSL